MAIEHIPKEPETYKNVGLKKKTRFFGKTRGFYLEPFGEIACVGVTEIHPTGFQYISNVWRSCASKTHKIRISQEYSEYSVYRTHMCANHTTSLWEQMHHVMAQVGTSGVTVTQLMEMFFLSKGVIYIYIYPFGKMPLTSKYEYTHNITMLWYASRTRKTSTNPETQLLLMPIDIDLQKVGIDQLFPRWQPW